MLSEMGLIGIGIAYFANHLTELAGQTSFSFCSIIFEKQCWFLGFKISNSI